MHETFSECTGTIFLQLILSNIVGGSIAFWFVSHVRPSKKVGISAYKILRPFNDLMSSAPLLHGTVFRLLPIPFRPIINFLLGITNITFSQYVKTAALASLFETMTWEALKGIVHQIQDSKYRVSQSLIAHSDFYICECVGQVATGFFIFSFLMAIWIRKMGPTKSPL